MNSIIVPTQVSVGVIPGSVGLSVKGQKLEKLEMMRGFSAMYVVIGHFLLPHLETGWMRLPLRFGQEAVMLFFLISGFVIFNSTEKQQPNFKTYFGKRFKRIYPIFILVLILSAVDIGLVGSEPFPWPNLFGNIFMLQDFSYGKPGTWFSTFGNNSPLWSLSYEWWFYLLFFPLWKFVLPRRQWIVASGLSLLGLLCYVTYPNQIGLYLMYFILWWTGAEFGRQYAKTGKVTLGGQARSLVVLGIFCILVTILLLGYRIGSGPLSFGLYPILQIRHFTACLIIIAAALLWQRWNWIGFVKVFGIFKMVAPISYGLYVLHYPIGVSGSFLIWASPWEKIPLAIVLSFALAWIAEGPFQNYINRLKFRAT